MPLRRFVALFRRYAACHLRVSLPGMPLLDEAGAPAGHLDRIGLRGSRLTAEGWTTAASVSLSLAGVRSDAVPGLARPDVASVRPDLAQARPGFAIEVAMGPGRPMLGLGWPAGRVVHPLYLPRRRIAAARRGLWRPFLRDLARAAPALARWALRHDPADRARVKHCLGLADPVPPQCLQRLLFLDDSLAALPPAARPSEKARLRPAGLGQHAISIILPVHNAMDLLPEALDRVLRHTDLPWRLILIEDASSDPAVRPFLRDWAARANAADKDRVTLVEHAQNLGFIGAVNAGLERALALGRDVVLLNSDAFVPRGWASRLMRPFLAHDDVASVTPMSNDAEILGVPAISARIDLGPGEADDLDRLAHGFHPDAGLTDVPTGVGFCMAMAIGYLRRLPKLDPAFGRGYGEEVDWCQRVSRLGGRHLAVPGLFVEHRGGASFGSAEKTRLIRQNNALISNRYPGFDGAVQDFIRRDPLATPRLALGIALAAGRARGRLPIYLGHSLGGGAEDYLADRIAGDLVAVGAAIVVRVGGGLRWTVELHMAEGVTSGATDDFGFVRRLLDPVAGRDIVYSCGVGDPAPAELPDLLLSLKRSASDRIEVLFHDYLPVSPSYTLLNADGRFSGLPDPDLVDPAHVHTGRNGRRTGLADWQTVWGRLIGAADTATVFSQDSRRLVTGAFAGVGRRLRLRPHRLLSTIAPCVAATGQRPVIGVLGNIGRQKGAALLAQLSRHLARTGAADLVILGNLDPEYALEPPARIHGSYRREDISALAHRYGIDRWLIPSIWPETFSFTTHEAIATGLPVWCFDLGAQAEAVRAAIARGGRGGTLDLATAQPDPAALIAAMIGPAPAERVRSVA